MNSGCSRKIRKAPKSQTMMLQNIGEVITKALFCCVSFGFALPASWALETIVDESRPLSDVDPYIGSGGHGHVFVGASVPFGGVQMGPTNFEQGWDWHSGYHYSDDVMTGFTLLHLNGTGCGDLSEILFMPYMGELSTNRGTRENPDAGFSSRYSHDREVARPGYYAVMLDDGIKAELTATERVGVMRYTFPSDDEAHVIIDLKVGQDSPTETYLEKIDATTVVGYRYSKGWASDQREYFVAEFSQPVESLRFFDDEEPSGTNSGRAGDPTSFKARNVKGVVSFESAPDELLVKVALSPVSIGNARLNLKTELPHWDFEKVVQQANEKWSRELSKVAVTTRDESDRRIFYTALYHTMIAPTLYNDVNGDYRGTDKKVYTDPGFTNYTLFSLWDTYRAQHPLLTILQPERVPDMVASMLKIYEHQGKLPIWHLRGNETDTMVGYSGVPVVVDAYFKGFEIDPVLAWQAVEASSNRNDRGLKWVREKGFIPSDREVESVAKALEYAISDWSIAQFAKSLNKNKEYRSYLDRGRNYRRYFDPETQFMRGRKEDGSWNSPFDPVRSTHRADDYCEGNAWQYTWLVPQEVEGLISLFGGDAPFTRKLDELFSVEEDLGSGSSSDISGLIGMYCSGNEPDHHVIYLYAYAGQQWKSAKRARQVMQEMYLDAPNGLSGNEDCGQMSAWYVLSSLGLYQVNPVNGCFVFGSPMVDEARIQLPGGRSFDVEAVDNSHENIYIQSATLNGEPYRRSFITYRDIMKGGKLVFKMGPEPNKEFGADPENRPKSVIY